MKVKFHTLLPLLMLGLATACRDVPTLERVDNSGDPFKDNYIAANRIIAQSEEQQIEAYATRRGWQMERLPGGGRIMPLAEGSGSFIDYEDTVQVEYSIETLAGQPLYAAREDTLVCGHLQPTRGLDAALRRLRHGSQAVVVLPSEQAYGVVGDGQRIGSRMVLVYKIKVR